MKELAICLVLIGLFIAAMLLVGQRDQQLDAINARIDLVAAQVGHGNIPQINVMGKTTSYPVDGEILIKEIKK